MTEVTGTDLLRKALIARNSKFNLALFGRDLDLNADLIHNFIRGADLNPDQKRAVCQYLWPYTIWDEATDKLMPAHPQVPKPQGILPTFNIALPKYQSGAAQQPGPQPVKHRAPAPKPKTRPGWLSGWF